MGSARRILAAVTVVAVGSLAGVVATDAGAAAATTTAWRNGSFTVDAAGVARRSNLVLKRANTSASEFVPLGTTPAQADTALELIEHEIASVVKDGITPDELERAKGSMRGGLALALEDANSRMVRLGRDELTGAPHYSVDERLALLEAVTLDDVRQVAADVMTGPRVIGAVGPFAEGALDKFLSPA